MIMPITIDGEIYLNTSEAMGRLGVSRPTFDKLVKEKQLKRYRQGVRQVAYYKEADLDKLLEIREFDTRDK